MVRPRVGIVGAGSITSLHVPFWQRLGWQVSVYALEGAPALADRYGIQVEPTLDGLLASADVVDVCSSSASHASLATLAVRRGLPVVCEKPMALSFKESLDLAAEARRRGVRVLPAHVVRFFGQYEAVHRAVRGGALGDLAVLRFVRGGARPDGAWFLDEAQSGGIVFDLMVHDLDQARWLAGEVRSVHAVQNPPSADGQVPPEVVAHATLVHDGGAISQVQSFWGSPGFTFGPSFDVAGSAGRLVSSPDHEVTVFEDLPGIEAEQSYLPPETAEESPYFSQLEEFSRALLQDDPCRVAALDGVMAVGLAEAARTSIQTGEPVDFLPWREQIADAL
ncbi:Gfo/Idh/MocA family protein [Angustibacter luteus]|uniref:Gfo/Idh/MocA family protein n=1 Tax=Angustibacter luteus TaxID=658456 RepID=A0ABW1J9E5_9ACTN